MIRYALSLVAVCAMAAEPGVVELAAKPDAASRSSDLRSAAKTRDLHEIRLGPGVFPITSSFTAGVTVRGAGSGQTVLRFVAPGAKDTGTPDTVAVLLAGGTLEGLAIEVERTDGTALRASAGTLRDVLLRSKQTTVAATITGGVWCERLRIEGFATGVVVDGGMLTGRELACTGQGECAVKLIHGLAVLRGLAANGGTCAVQVGEGSLADLTEVTATGMPAVKGPGAVRAIAVSGTPRALDLPGAPSDAKVPAWAGPAIPAGAQPLGLPVQEPPAAPTADPDDVALAEAQAPGEATVISWGKPIKLPDWTAAIQAAIDSGKPVVRLPGKKVFAQGVIHVRGSVRRIEGAGFHEIYHGSQELYTLQLAIEDGSAPVVELAGLSLHKANVTIAHGAKRAVVLRQVRGGAYAGADGSGDVFSVRCAMTSFAIGNGQHAWIHGGSLSNTRGPALVNRGGDLWAMALGVDRWTSLLSATGGRSELVGCQVRSTSLRPKDPLIVAAPSAQVAAGFLERPQFAVPYDRLACDPAGIVLVPRSAAAQGATGGALEAEGEAPAPAEGDEEAAVREGGDDVLLRPATGSVVPLLRLPK